MNTKKKKTVKEIIEQLNFDKKINYGLARNYEKFPIINSDLDIIFSGNKKILFEILKKISKKTNWDILLYDHRRSKGYNFHNKIEIFYFLNVNNLDFLQVDFFRSISLMGLPYFEFSKKNKFNKYKDFYIVPKRVSYTYHLFQIESLLSNKKKNEKKIIKYTSNINKIKKNFFLKNILFEEFLLKKSTNFLNKKNYLLFSLFIKIYKFLFFFKFMLFNPLKIYYIFFRFYELFLTFVIQNFGINFIYYYSKNIELKKIYKFLNNLKRKQILQDWSISEKYNLISKLKFLERRNVLLSIYKKKNIKKINIKKSFISKFILNLRVIYKK